MRVYLDYNATAPLSCAARQAIKHCLGQPAANPSSLHWAGRTVKALLEESRERVASVIGAAPYEVIFTSGGTESNNLAILGVPNLPLVTTATEHSSILRCADWAGCRLGRQILVLPVDSQGRLDPDQLAAALAGRRCLVSVGLANNEIGTIQEVGALSAAARHAGGLLHVDAVQAAGKLAINVGDLGADLLSLSAHKVGGPAGVGALYVRKGVELQGAMFGGAQEGGRRPGTENLMGVVAFAAALSEAEKIREFEAGRLGRLRDKLWQGVSAMSSKVVRNSPAGGVLPNTLNVSFAGIDGAALAAALDLQGIAVSTGSACAAGAPEPSHVLKALGRNREEIRGAIRFSLGTGTTEAEIEYTLEVLATALKGMLEALVDLKERGL